MHFDFHMLKDKARGFGGLGLGRRGRRDRDMDGGETLAPPEDWSALVRREIRDRPPESYDGTAGPAPRRPSRPAAPRPERPERPGAPEQVRRADRPADFAPAAPDPVQAAQTETTAPADWPEAQPEARPDARARARRRPDPRPQLRPEEYELVCDPQGRQLPPTERLDDPAEALQIDLDEGTPGHIHLVHGRARDLHTESAWVDIYLSHLFDLPDEMFDDETGLYDSEGACRLLRVELGSLRRQIRPGGAPGRINEDPDLRFDRPVASEAEWIAD